MLEATPNSPLSALRSAFDEGFALGVRADEGDTTGFLVVRVGDRRFAIGAAHTGGVLRCPPVISVPGAQEEVLGICRLRGALVAAYSLGALLGAEPTTQGDWALILGPGRTDCVVFSALERYVRVPTGEVRREESGSWITVEGALLQIVDPERLVARVSTLPKKPEHKPEHEAGHQPEQKES